MKKWVLAAVAALCLLAGCGETAAEAPAERALTYDALQVTREYAFAYANQVAAEELEGGYWRLQMSDGSGYRVVPEGAEPPAGVPAKMTVLRQPLDEIYLVSSAAGDYFRALDAVDAIRFSAIAENSWYVSALREAMAAGEIAFAGKYSTPDYEVLYSGGCDVAVQNTMIYHSPDVKEQLEKLGIPCFVDVSSYEAHPLGRIEWVKVYGILLGRLAEAEALFNADLAAIEPVMQQAGTGKTVAFFSVTTNGSFTVRKDNDYVAKTIALAGGEYIFTGLGDENALGTVNLQAEAFYDGAKDADVLIYNSTVASELYTMDELLQLAPVLADFKAVQSGDVWCTGKNLFQEPTGLGQLILDIHTVLSEGTDAPVYLHRLK